MDDLTLEERVARLEARVAVFETAIRLARWGGPLIVAVAALLVQAYK